MSRLDRIIDNYEVRTRLEAEGRLSERDIQARLARFSISAARDDAVLNQTRQVLCMHGVHTIIFPAYHAFSRELGKLTREDFSVETQQREMMWRVEKWVIRGLSREVLLDIAINVFNLPPPSSTQE